MERAIARNSALTKGGHSPPAKDFSNGCTKVRKILLILQRGHARSADDNIKLLVTSRLLVWVSYHG